MSIFENITRFFDQQNATNSLLYEQQTPYIAEAANLITHCLAEGGKILALSPSDYDVAANFLVHHLVHSRYIERPGLPAMQLNGKSHGTLTQALTTFANAGDVVIVFADQTATSELPPLIASALESQLRIIVVCSCPDDVRDAIVPPEHVVVNINSTATDHTLQQLLIAQLLAQLTEQALFGINL
ncbi:Uncharacterised protein [BD1-7 clade bacterium]|uniref:SIS domain-containing protein n=1 Tax=BD1-7 clade bacterium TaxID=2029982 RepID=A0A5S9N2T7_9GAMM|nr:Uncharacterised protein [BD1-7 clade bacterium]